MTIIDSFSFNLERINFYYYFFHIIKENRKIMLSQSHIQDLHYFDIICIGNFGAIAAERIAKRKPQKYKIAVLNFKRKIKQLAISGLGSEQIEVTNQPKGVDIIQGSISKIVPAQRILILNNTKRLLYKFLIYGQQNWKPNMGQHPLIEALSCEYSRVFYDLQNYDQLIKDKGNIIIYVPKGPGKFRECYPFLRIAQKLQNKKDYYVVILLQGNSFFPHCKEAHFFIQQHLKKQEVKIIYNVTKIRVDYLRRIFYYKEVHQHKQLVYSSVFCLIADQVPKLLSDSGIDPFSCNRQLLHNTQYDSIYVVGADNLPTTKTFYASALQLHYSVQNILQRFKTKKFHNKSKLCAYNGDTKLKITVSNKQTVEIKHSYIHNSCEIFGTGCIKSMLSKYIDSYLLRQFWNFNNYGPPHYLWLPPVQNSPKLEQLTENKQNEQQVTVFNSY